MALMSNLTKHFGLALMYLWGEFSLRHLISFLQIIGCF